MKVRVVVVTQKRPVPSPNLCNLGKRTVFGVHLECASLWSTHGSSKNRVNHASMTRDYHGLAKVLRNNGVQPRVHPLMKLGNGLATREKLGMRIAAPVWGAMTPNKYCKCKPVTFGAWVVLAESSVNIDSQAR
jgi:hypothetical protein